MFLLVLFTLLCVCWSLWVRRFTWRCRWEVAATLNIALQGGAVFLMSPYASETLGLWLYRHTGHYNLEDYLGHDLYIVAASAIVYNAIGRLGDDQIMQRRFSLFVEKPATLCIPLMLATFVAGNGSRVYAPDFFDVPTDTALRTYWTIMCVTLIWLIGYAMSKLWMLRDNPSNRIMANVYILACTSAIITCLVRLATAYSPAAHNADGGKLVWVFACICGAVFALAGGYSWITKTRGFKALLAGVKG